MTSTGARSIGDRTRDDGEGDGRRRALTPAQMYCLAAGVALLLAGLLGFIVDSSFDTSASGASGANHADGMLQGKSLLGFEVNGWHNVVHVLSGLVLLAAWRKRRSAKAVALGFGVVYGIVTIIGLIDGNDVLGLIPVNAADNVLHVALSAAGIITGLISRADEDPARTVGDGERARTA